MTQVLVVDLFAPNEPIKPFHGNRPYSNDDADVIQFYMGLIKEEELDLVLRDLRQEIEI